MSVASASGTAPTATAIAEPPLEPPGLRVASRGSLAPGVSAPRPSSSVRVLPRTIAPAARSRATIAASAAATRPCARPSAVGQAGDVDQVLDRDGNTVQRAARAPRQGRGRTPRAVLVHDHEGTVRLRLAQAREARVEDLER